MGNIPATHIFAPAPDPPPNYEQAIVGMTAIAAVFHKNSGGFWQKHGKELRELGVVFNLSLGNPRRIYVAAFMSELIQWSKFKMMKQEAI